MELLSDLVRHIQDFTAAHALPIALDCRVCLLLPCKHVSCLFPFLSYSHPPRLGPKSLPYCSHCRLSPRAWTVPGEALVSLRCLAALSMLGSHRDEFFREQEHSCSFMWLNKIQQVGFRS